MSQVASSVLIMGFNLLLAYYIMPTGTARFLIPFFLIFFVLNPLYIFVPTILINRHIRLSNLHRIGTLRERLAKAEDTTDTMQVNLLKLELSRVRVLPTELFSITRAISFFVLYLIPTILFLDWVVEKFFRR